MPGVVATAMCGLAFVWGWVRVGTLIAAARCALLRPIEFLGAKRKHLILPADCMFVVKQALFVIEDPKSRRMGQRRRLPEWIRLLW